MAWIYTVLSHGMLQNPLFIHSTFTPAGGKVRPQPQLPWGRVTD